MEEIEEWRDVVCYEWLYQVSNKGRVKRVLGSRTTQCKNKYSWDNVLHNMIHRAGYLYVTLRKNNKRLNMLVHRLVAIAFLENKYNKSSVDHKDNNRKNNNIDNLQWVTHQENLQFSYTRDRRLVSPWCWERMTKINYEEKAKPVAMFSKSRWFIKNFRSLNEVYRELWIPKSSIKRNITWKDFKLIKYKDFYFKYIKNELNTYNGWTL